MNKELAIFWLKRRIRDLESAPPDQEAMAKRGLSYAERRQAVAQAEGTGTTELATMQDVLAFVEAKA